MGGTDPQELIDEELLSTSDILVAIFKGQSGKTKGAIREVRNFVTRKLAVEADYAVLSSRRIAAR